MAVDELILAELRKLNARTAKLAYSVDEAADVLGVSPSMIRKLVADNDLVKVPHLGARIVIAHAELERFVAETRADLEDAS